MSIKVNFSKYHDGLVPSIIQDLDTSKVLMMGFMNQEAFDLTMSTEKITFYSRSKQRIWVKGEESGNFLHLKSCSVDCDQDTLLFKVKPDGPTCHTGSDTCWGEVNHSGDFLDQLEKIIELRKSSNDASSYVKSLFEKGINKIAQKVGEESVELVIEAKDQNSELFLNEAADLLFHYLILLNAKGYALHDVKQILQQRQKK
jgi:phosphoribosyl-ATP pyrophosphohydrolase/phosphoribosyl-AMP cyclohydrolase